MNGEEHVRILLNRMAIVLTGSFNPVIFQPAWFARNGILRDAEAVEADVQLINPQLTHFRTAWLEFQVTRDRFVALSRNGGYEGPIFDLVVSVFTLLEHTPLRELGMNREVQLQFDTVERWHEFGHILAPKTHWNEILREPGLLTLQMQGTRAEPGARVNVTITSRGEKRVDIEINEHRIATSPDSATAAIQALREGWDQAQSEGTRIVEHLLRLIS